MKEGWNTSTLEELCLFFGDGNWIESKDQSKEGYRLIQTGNIGNGEFKNKSGKERYIDEETFKRLRCTEIFEGDILVSRLPEPVGRTCIIPDLNCKMITAVDCTIIRTNNEKILSNYLKYFTQSILYFESIKEKITGTTRDRISRKNLGKILISYPSLSEQQCIVEILDTAFAKIDTVKQNAERNLINAKELFESVLDFELTSNKEFLNLKISDVCYEIFAGGDAPSNYSEYKTEDNNIPIFANAVKCRGLYGYTNYARVTVPSITIAARGSGTGHVELRREPFLPIVRLIVLIPNTEIIILEYLKYCISNLQIMRSGSAIPQLTVPMIKGYMLQIPPLSDQQQIVSKLDALSAKCKELEKNYLQTINNCNELKKAILAKAFNGEL